MFETDYQAALEWIRKGHEAIMVHHMFPNRENDPRERWLRKKHGILVWVYPDGQYLEALPKDFWADRKWIVRSLK